MTIWIYMGWLLYLNGMFYLADTTVVQLEFTEITRGLIEATSIYKTPDEELFVVESGSNRILKLDRNGNRLDSLGRMGFGDYRFDRPLDVDATNGLKIYVSDYNNRRVQVFDRRLQYLSTVNLRDMPAAGRVYRPTRIVVNAFGELFVLDEEQTRLVKINRNGRFEYDIDLRTLGLQNMPVSMTVVDEMIFLADPADGLVHIIEGGSYSRYIGGLEPILALTRYGDSIWAAGNRIIYEIDRRGRVVREFESTPETTPAGIAAGKDGLYLLGSGRVWKALIPPPGD